MERRSFPSRWPCLDWGNSSRARWDPGDAARFFLVGEASLHPERGPETPHKYRSRCCWNMCELGLLISDSLCYRAGLLPISALLNPSLSARPGIQASAVAAPCACEKVATSSHHLRQTPVSILGAIQSSAIVATIRPPSSASTCLPENFSRGTVLPSAPSLLPIRTQAHDLTTRESRHARWKRSETRHLQSYRALRHLPAHHPDHKLCVFLEEQPDPPLHRQR